MAAAASSATAAVLTPERLLTNGQGQAAKVPVTTGLTTGETTEIVEGLGGGEQLIVKGQRSRRPKPRRRMPRRPRTPKRPGRRAKT